MNETFYYCNHHQDLLPEESLYLFSIQLALNTSLLYLYSQLADTSLTHLPLAVKSCCLKHSKHRSVNFTTLV